MLEQQEKQMEAIKPFLNMKAIEGSKANLPIELKTNNMGTIRLSKLGCFNRMTKVIYFLMINLLILRRKYSISKFKY